VSGAALILDDVRAGFRLALGGSWETVGVRPDLSAFSKAIANGYPLGAIAGERPLARGGDEDLHHRVVLVRGGAHGRGTRDARPNSPGSTARR
jgi:glutamate-1-semialdehyde aminotransferase